jgi:hypothetical protein
MLEGQARTARALVLIGLGRPAEAADDATRAIAIHAETGHRPGWAQAHRLLGLARTNLGRAEAAGARR